MILTRIQTWVGPFMPREHGALGVLAAAFLLGVLSSPIHALATVSLFAATSGVFLMRAPVLRGIRIGMRDGLAPFPVGGWVICAGLAAFGGLGLAVLQRWWLGAVLAAGAAVLAMEAREAPSEPRARMIHELLGSLAVSLAAPAAAYASSGDLGWREATVGVLSAVYFGVTTLDVRWRVARLYAERAHGPQSRVQSAARERRAAIFLAMIGIAAFWIAAPAPTALLGAFLPLVYRLWRPAGRPSGSLVQDIRRLGWQEVRFSAGFVLLSALLLRALWPLRS